MLEYDKLAIEINMIELTEAGQIAKHKDFTVRAFPVTHRGSGNFAFTFKENDHRPFLADKAAELGVPVGPERAQLVRGDSITLEDGTVIQPEDVLGKTEPGIKLVITGDIGRTDNIAHEVEGADVLVTEATFLREDGDAASSFGHLTAARAAQLAKDMGVRCLILNHVSRRYRERDIIDEARSVFDNTYVTRDFDRYVIRRGQAVRRVVMGREPTEEN